ncbi:hypothetical protein DPMN_064837 [Dreissena polymorpha]|uniref:Uncharacterized protein n=1 Tax=Dreissena polymorpha TaxID=45954 RepID=A0A9D4CEB8_DREPO|nr:hypothetical protein DPMN_064837 [Dreissena polymorpha]
MAVLASNPGMEGDEDTLIPGLTCGILSGLASNPDIRWDQVLLETSCQGFPPTKDIR